MAGPGGREVGRASIRVLPNTSDFARSLRRYLNRIERTEQVQIPVVLDDRKTAQDMREIMARLRAQVGKGIDIPVNVDRSTLSNLTRGARGGRVTIDVDAEMSGFRQRIQAELAAVKREFADIPVTPDTDRLRGELASEIAFIERSLRMEIPADPDLRAGFRQRLQAQVNIAAAGVRASVPVEIDVDRDRRLSRSLRLLTPLVRGLGQGFDLASGAASKLGQAIFTTLLRSLVSFGIQAVILFPIIAALAGLLGGTLVAAIGSVSAGLLGLPALLFAIGVPIAAIALGIEGIKDAAEPLKEPFEELRAVVSDVFREDLAIPFERLAAVIPQLGPGLAFVAGALSDMALSLVGVVDSESGLRAINGILAGTADLLIQVTPSLSRFIDEILQLVGTTGLLHILGGVISNFFDGFAGLLERARETGVLEDALWGVHDVLVAAGGALSEFIFGSMEFFAAAAPGFIRFWEGARAAIAAIDWAALGEDFGRIFAAIGDGMARVPPETWQRLAVAVDEFATRVEEFVAAGGIEKMINLFIRLVELAPSVLSALLSLGEGLLDLLGWMFSTNGEGTRLQHGWRVLQDLARALGAALRGDLIGAFNALRSAIGFTGDENRSFWQGFGDAAQGGLRRFGGIIPGFEGLLGRLLNSSLRTTDQMGRGVQRGMVNVSNEFRRMPPTAIKGISGYNGAFRSAGLNLSLSMADGIRSGAAAAAAAAASVAAAAAKAARANLAIASPSKVGIEIGRFFGQGIAVGISDSTFEVESATAGLARAAEVEAVSAMRGIARAATRLRSDSAQPATADEIGEAVASRLDGARLRVDGDEWARLVNKANLRDARRR